MSQLKHLQCSSTAFSTHPTERTRSILHTNLGFIFTKASPLQQVLRNDNHLVKKVFWKSLGTSVNASWAASDKEKEPTVVHPSSEG